MGMRGTSTLRDTCETGKRVGVRERFFVPCGTYRVDRANICSLRSPRVPNPRRFPMADVQPIPEGMEGVIPYLACDGASDAIDFYRRAFGADELYRFEAGGMIGHVEIKIGGSRIMLADVEGVP